MAFLRDDDALALGLLAICDAIEDGATNAEARQQAVNKARKHAHAVLDRGRKNQDHTPVDEPEGKEDE